MNRINIVISTVVAALCLYGCYENENPDNQSIYEPTASCNDGIQNGNETGVDCGGICKKRCSGNNNITPNTCTDNQKNGDETDVDCGGSCGQSANEKHCNINKDCTSNNCENNTCKPPSLLCSDGALSGDESDVDCGGSCALCEVGKKCNSDDDCNGFCDAQVCTSCTDGIKNGDEVNVDCGGRCGATCAAGSACSSDNDCESYNCSGNICKASDCPDMAENGEIIINEVFANPDTEANMEHSNNHQMKYIELYNKSSKSLQLNNLVLTYNANEIHANGCIPAKSYLIIHPSTQTLTALDIDAKTLPSDNIEAAINALSGSVKLLKRSDRTVIHSATVPETEKGTSAGRAKAESESTDDEAMVPHSSINTKESGVKNLYSPGLPNNTGFPMG